MLIIALAFFFIGFVTAMLLVVSTNRWERIPLNVGIWCCRLCIIDMVSGALRFTEPTLTSIFIGIFGGFLIMIVTLHMPNSAAWAGLQSIIARFKTRR